MASVEPTPDVSNPPGLPAIAYRSGTQVSVLARMRAALATRLPKLAAAAVDDPGVALLDAWATVADVVTFYQERIANEGYLGTATERRSVLELARSIGYELRPGVSAATVVDLRTQATAAPATGPLAAPSRVVVAKGTRVLSVPGRGELPQTFETDDEVTLDAACDEIPLVRTEKQTLGTTTTEIYLEGLATGLRAGDAILVVERPLLAKTIPATGVPPVHDFRVLRTVVPQTPVGPGATPTTVVTWDTALGHDYARPVVYAFDVQTTIFGYNAPDWRTLPDTIRVNYLDPPHGATWPGFKITATEPIIDLATPHPDIATGSFLVLTDPGPILKKPPGGTVVYRVVEAKPSALENFAISARTTRVTVNVATELDKFDRRRTTVHTLTRQLALARRPIGRTVKGKAFAPDLPVPLPLVAGRPVVVTGTSPGGDPVLQQATIASVTRGSVVLDRDLPEMQRDSVRILGNIVAATNGETVPAEVLGSGDGSAANQRFTLQKPDVTHVLSPQAPGGVADSLEIRVDGIAWKEVPSLYPAGPQDRVYVVRIDDDAVATVIFGDGEHGARLPTGQENVIARYRSGVGPAGEVEAHTLIVLPQRPPGVASVDNPFPAGGASAPETLAEARTNAPLAVVTLDRVVALRDYEDFARAYGGIAKARATALRSGASTFVFVTVAGTGGKAVPEQTLDSLRKALDAKRDQAAVVQVQSHETARFRLALDVLAAPYRDRGVVKAAVADALRAAFAVDRRDFGQAVTVAEVTGLVHGVEGVVACRVTELRRDVTPLPTPPVEDILALDARVEPDRVAPAELLLVNPDAVDVRDMAP